jgi:hypothetical protein
MVLLRGRGQGGGLAGTAGVRGAVGRGHHMNEVERAQFHLDLERALAG